MATPSQALAAGIRLLKKVVTMRPLVARPYKEVVWEGISRSCSEQLSMTFHCSSDNFLNSFKNQRRPTKVGSSTLPGTGIPIQNTLLYFLSKKSNIFL